MVRDARGKKREELSLREKKAAEALIRHCREGKVLDFPCGGGRLSRYLQGKGYDVVAADIQPEIFKAEGIPWRSVDLNGRFDFEDQSFDAVCCVAGMEHAENPYHVAREIKRVLKPGGYLMLQVPNFSNLTRRMRFIASGRLTKRELALAGHETPRAGSVHIACYPLENFRHVLHTAGLEIVEECPFHATWKTAFWLMPLWVPMSALGWLASHTSARHEPIDSVRPRSMLNKEIVFVARKPADAPSGRPTG